MQQQRKTAKSTGVVSFLFGTSLLTYNIKDSAVSLFDYYYSGVWDYDTQVYKAQRERVGLLEPSLLSGAWRGRRPSVSAKERSQKVFGLIPRQREKYHATALAVGIMLMGPFIRITEVASGISYRGSWLLSVRKQLQ